MFKNLKEEIDQKKILMHDSDLMGKYGFTKNKYAASNIRKADIHCNAEFWTFLIKKLL